uniref:solute carrier family 22 member 7-like n=1 Tax=Doryrhamphus excisus TaxID=161450 RepID=UPI0025AEC0A9|nr:solute carrier family 22 member 7-like [Doryrhamphus excisus]
MAFDNILDDVGSFGLYQMVLAMLLVSPRIVIPCHFLLNNFIAAVPPHRCNVNPLDHGGLLGNLSEAQRVAVSIPLRGNGEPQACRMFAQPQFQMLENRSDGTGLPSTHCRHGWIYLNDTFSSTLATEWDLVCDWKHLPNTTSTIFFMGVMIGAIVFGVLCDNYGRRRCLLASYIIATVFGFSSAFANSYTTFAVLRFATGVGLTGISITSFTLNIEWVNAAHRSSVCVMGSLAWSAGNMLLAAYAYLVNDWRPLIMTVTAPLGLAILTWWWVPESARWLLAHGKVEEAQFYLNKCAEMNKKAKISKFKLEAEFRVETLEKKKSYTYLHLFKTPKLRRLTLVMGVVWYGVAVTYYGISLNIVGFGLSMYLTHFIYAAIEVPAKLLIYVLINKIGRRKCLAGTLILTGTCIVINIFVPKGLWHLRSAVAILGKGLSEASFTTVYLYTTELYPTVIRQNGLGYTSFTSRVGVSVAPLILLLEDAWTLLPQVILAVGAIGFGLVALMLPETLNTRLPETIDDVEKPKSGRVTQMFLLNRKIADSCIFCLLLSSQSPAPTGVLLETRNGT